MTEQNEQVIEKTETFNEFQEIKKQFYEVLDEIKLLERYFNFENLRKIESLDRLDDLKELNNLSKLHELKSLSKLNSLEKLERLDGLSNLSTLDELKNLDWLGKLSELKELVKLEELQRLDKLDKIPEIEERLQTVVKNFDLFQKLEQLKELDRLDSLNNLDQLESLGQLGHLDRLDNLKNLEKLETLENLKSLKRLDHLSELDRLSDLEQLSSFHLALKEYGHLLLRLEKLDELVKLDGLEKLDQLANLSQISNLSSLSELNRLSELKNLSSLDQMSRLDNLHELKELQALNKLDSLAGLDKLDLLKKLDKVDKLEKVIESPAWNNLKKLGLLEEKKGVIYSTLAVRFAFDLIKISLVAVLITFGILYTVSNSQLNSMLTYLNINSAPGVNLTLPILSKVSRKDAFSKVYKLTKGKILEDVNVFWNLKHKRSLENQLDRLHYLFTLNFKDSGFNLTKEIQDLFNLEMQKAIELQTVEFDNLIAGLSKDSDMGVLLRRIKYSYTNGRCLDSLKLNQRLTGESGQYFKNITNTLSLICIYQSSKQNYQKVSEIISGL